MTMAALIRLISEHQSVNPSREATSILFGKHKRFSFVHSVTGYVHCRYLCFVFLFDLVNSQSFNVDDNAGLLPWEL